MVSRRAAICMKMKQTEISFLKYMLDSEDTGQLFQMICVEFRLLLIRADVSTVHE
jgi:hypothetical protein